MTNKQTTKNQRYNAERKAQAELIKRDIDRDKVLARLYQESFTRMQSEIDRFYLAYAKKEGLTKQEAMKKASEFDVTKFAKKAEKAVKEKDFSPKTNSWLRTYNLKMKVSRLELLKSELALEIQNLTSEVNEVFDKARRDELTNELRRQSGILGNSATRAPKRLEAILDADFYGQNFSSRIWGRLGLQADLQRDVFSSLNRIYTDMMGYKQEMARLAKKYETSKANAQRLLKTEIARINADTQLAMLKENGFTHMIYVAEPGACDICGPLDQKAIPIDKVEKGVNMFPMHPNCRCSAYGHIKMDYKKGGSTLDEYELWESPDKTVVDEGNQKANISLTHNDKFYSSVKEDWLKNVDPNKANLTDRTFWEHDGKKYEVDGHDVVLDYKPKEKETALWLSQLFGKHVEMVPRFNEPEGVSTPDYLIDGVPFDLKGINGLGKYVIDGNLKKAKTQAENIVFDFSNSELTDEEILKQMNDIYRSGRRGLNVAILKREETLIDVMKKKD